MKHKDFPGVTHPSTTLAQAHEKKLTLSLFSSRTKVKDTSETKIAERKQNHMKRKDDPNMVETRKHKSGEKNFIR